MTKDNICFAQVKPDLPPEITPTNVINWIKSTSEKLQPFFESVVVIPFGDLCIIHPKDMPKEKAVEMLKKYCEVYVNED